MSSSARCWSERRASLAFALVLAAACSHAPRARPSPETRRLRVAVFPPHDLAGAGGAVAPLMQGLRDACERAGLGLVTEEATDSSLGKRRHRWVGGVDAEAARAIREDLGVDAVLLTAIQAQAAGPPPLLSIAVRLVSVDPEPAILWTGGFAATGNDWRGLFGTGTITDLARLQARAAAEIGASLSRFARGEAGPWRCAPSGAFEPKSVHRGEIDPTAPPRVAVLPFLNRTVRENAGEVLALELLGQLHEAGFAVADPGLVRSVLLQRRIVFRGGVSEDHARELLDVLGADLVLSGEVREFEQSAGEVGAPRVEFTARLLDREGLMVWQSRSRNTGQDAVRLFDFGAVRTVTGLACRMAATLVAQLSAPARRRAAVLRRRRRGERLLAPLRPPPRSRNACAPAPAAGRLTHGKSE